MNPGALASLLAASARTRSSVCCGLDLDSTRLPLTLLPSEPQPERILAFAGAVAAITHPLVCCYKVQKAFLEVSEAPSLAAIVPLVRRYAPGTPVVLDAKLGDVEHTLRVYLSMYFDVMDFDGVVLNPYMGSEILESMRHWPHKTGYILVRTSNPGSSRLQKLSLRGGEELWLAVLRAVIAEWRRGTSVVPILSGFDVDALSLAAELLPPNMPVFISGVGAQGAPVGNLRGVFGADRQLIVNSSRDLIFPYRPSDPLWRMRIAEAATSLRDSLRGL